MTLKSVGLAGALYFTLHTNASTFLMQLVVCSYQFLYPTKAWSANTFLSLMFLIKNSSADKSYIGGVVV